jgi:hypothetical protein
VNLLPLAGGQPVLDLARSEAEAKDLLPVQQAMLVSKEPGQVRDGPFHAM